MAMAYTNIFKPIPIKININDIIIKKGEWCD